MCFFVTIAVPPNASDAVARAAGEFEISTQANGWISSHVGDRATFVVTAGMCSCDLYRRNDDGERARKKLEKARRKYAKRGWTQTKIESTVASLRTDGDRAPRFIGLREDARRLVARIADEVGEVAVLVHTYRGNIDTESVSATQGAVSTPDALRAGTVEIDEDVIVWIRRAGSA
jgi:hypothetical protein